jgi:hypothetical protein
MIRIVVALPGRSLSPLGQGAAAGFLVESEQSRDASTVALLVEVCDQLAEQGAKRPDTAQLRAGPRGAPNYAPEIGQDIPRRLVRDRQAVAQQ